MYFIVIIQNYSIPSIFSYNSYDDALVRFHNELAYRNASERTSTVCIIMDAKGNEICRDWYEKPEE